MTFTESFYRICSSVLPLLLCPIVTALVLRYSWRKAHHVLADNQAVSFYMWAVALFIVVGSSVSFIIKNFALSRMPEISGLVAFSAVACGLQFYVGRKVGAHFRDKVTGGQSLGQKNTVLDPIASIAPAAYVAWHNIVNSYQIIHFHKQQNKVHKETATK